MCLPCVPCGFMDFCILFTPGHPCSFPDPSLLRQQTSFNICGRREVRFFACIVTESCTKKIIQSFNRWVNAYFFFFFQVLYELGDPAVLWPVRAHLTPGVCRGGAGDSEPWCRHPGKQRASLEDVECGGEPADRHDYAGTPKEDSDAENLPIFRC